MLKKQMAEFLLNEHDSIIYVTEKQGYGLEYMNAKAKEFFGLPMDDLSYQDKKCYELFFNRKSPCATCVRPILNHDDFYRYDTYNEKLQEHFYHRVKFIKIEEEDYFFKITDIYTDKVKRQLEIEHQLETQRTLIRCIHTLTEEANVLEAISSLLQIVAEYYKGDRAYLFEINWETQSFSNTYEWVKENVSKEIDNMQYVPLSLISHWIASFEKEKQFYLSRLEEETPDSATYALLQLQNVQSLMAVPLIQNHVITGFIGVDNPRQNYEDFTLLSSVTHFILNDLEKRNVTEKLRDLSFIDSLTGLYNRNRYNHSVDLLRKSPPPALGILYLDLNGLKELNDRKGHNVGDSVLCQTSQVLLSLFRDDSYRIGGDEFVIILPNIPKKSFEDRVQQLHQRFAEKGIEISIGTSWCQDNVDICKQIKLADQRMYEEKEKFYKEKAEKN